MCRWLAYTGSPALLYDLIFAPKHSLVIQSLHSTMGKEITNGDGFGVGWYGIGEVPALYRNVEPAWQDRNMLDLSKHIESTAVFAHVRAASAGVSTVQQTNCHPFRCGQWLWMHNGSIRNFAAIKREMMFFIDPKYFNEIEGTTDSEAFFYLALTFGLEEDPPTAVARAVGWIIKKSNEAGTEFPVQMTVATTNGSRIWAFRYSCEGNSRSLFYSTDKESLRDSFEDPEMGNRFGDNTRFIVSEPLGDIPGAWNPVPESSCVFVSSSSLEITPFLPIFDD
jgi:predicted glutamine amidotransferase